MTAETINPFLLATMSVFSRMLGLELVREKPFVRGAFAPQHDVTGIIGLSGTSSGTVAVSMPREMALAVTEILLGERPTEVNAQVVDAVGELTNMIAGAAKARLEAMSLSLGLPTVLVGKGSAIAFPSRATPISIPFSSTLGPIVVEVGLML
jgi:chemotaxis protein CheX